VFAEKALDKIKNIKESNSKHESRPKDYVELQMLLYFPFIGLRLMNYGQDILTFNFTDIESRFEYRSVAESYYFLVNARSVDADGVYYKDSLRTATSVELVPLIRSKKSKGEQNERSYEVFFNCLFKYAIKGPSCAKAAN
jgi:hypothetical protein